MSTDYDADTEQSSFSRKMGEIGNFFHNRETGKIMGRTGRSWGLILLFYTVYYFCLASFFIIMLLVFLLGTVPKDKPTLTGQQSLLKMSPGLGFRPQPDVRNTLIRFDPGNPKTYGIYVQHIQGFVDSYNKVNAWENINIINNGKICSDSSEGFARDNLLKYKQRRVCKFPLSSLGENCQSANGFGYPNGQPCVLLKLNRVFGWLPEIINNASNNVQIVCQGENPGDRENLGKVDYFPGVDVKDGNSTKRRGVFYSSYFPYLGQTGYRSPLVGVVFGQIKRKVVVMVECRVENVANAVVNKMARLGLVRFELLIEGNNFQ